MQILLDAIKNDCVSDNSSKMAQLFKIIWPEFKEIKGCIFMDTMQQSWKFDT